MDHPPHEATPSRTPTSPTPEPPAQRTEKLLDGPVVIAIAAVALLAAQQFLMPHLKIPALQTWSTIFVSICIQAMPFLVGGTLLSAAVAVLIPSSFFQRVVPRNSALAVPVAALGGMALPGCECASVPVSHSLMRRGVAPAAALTFLLAAPAINPIVLVSTAVAFQGQPEFVAARFIASLAVAVAMGWMWIGLGKGDLLRLPKPYEGKVGESKLESFRSAAVHDLLHAGGYLVIGAAIAAAVNVLVPAHVFAFIAERPWLTVIAMALFAVAVAMCSEADAFVAASFRQMGPTAQLVFMVVGPMVDVKLMSMQAGLFGRKFMLVFAPLTFILCVASASIVGWWLL